MGFLTLLNMYFPFYTRKTTARYFWLKIKGVGPTAHWGRGPSGEGYGKGAPQLWCLRLFTGKLWGLSAAWAQCQSGGGKDYLHPRPWWSYGLHRKISQAEWEQMRCIQRCSCQLVLLQGCLFVIFKRCPGVWFLTTGKKANITLIFGDDRKEDSGSSKLVSLAQVSRKIAEPAGSHFQANRQ